MNATIDQTHREHVSVSKDTRVLQMQIGDDIQTCLTQDTTTTTETWTGLTYADASSLLTSWQNSTLNGVTRNYLGGARVSYTIGLSTYWNTVDSCWGSEGNTSINRINDTHLYSVQRTTNEHVVHLGGQGTLQLV